MMSLTTDYCGDIDAPTGDDELDSLLSEIRAKTGRSWQCEVRTIQPKDVFLKIKKSEKFYELLLYVGGVMPYQLIMSGSGSLQVIKGYLIGYLGGLEYAERIRQGGVL